MVKVAVIGLGYWGPNLVRNFAAHDGAELRVACDLKASRRETIERSYPAVRTTDDMAPVLADPAIDAVVIATPTNTHYPIAKAALEAGKHVWVEKPMADSVAHAEELVEIGRAHV